MGSNLGGGTQWWAYKRVRLQTNLCNGAEAWEGARGGWVYEENVGSGLGGGRAGVGI